MSIKKRILFMIGTLKIGGTEKHLVELINNLNPDSYDINLLVMSESGELEKKIKKSVKIYLPKRQCNSKYKALLLLLETIAIIKKIKPDIIHTYLPFCYVIGGIASIISCTSKKLIMSRRSLNNYQNNHKFPIRIIEKFLHNFTSLFLTNSEASKKQLIEEGANKKKICVIYNGIVDDGKRLTQAQIKIFKKQLNIMKNDLIFSTIANFIPYKNHYITIRAAEKLAKITTKFKILLIGGNSNNDYLKMLKLEVKKRKLQNYIFFFPQQIENLYKFFNISDVGISSSKEEGFSNTIIEFLNYGKPVIATDVGGNPEVINRDNGILIKNDDEVDLFNAMFKCFSNKKLKKLSENAKKTAKNFSVQKMIEKYEVCYRKF